MRLLLLLLLFVLFSFTTFAQAPPTPGAKARCAVCGMFVAPYTNWVAVLETVDGKRFYFDGPKDLFKFHKEPGKYHPGVSVEQGELFVTEYYTVQLMSARDVFFVLGSDVLGPMGQELVPVAGQEAAETFKMDHAGTGLLRFDGRKLIEIPEVL